MTECNNLVTNNPLAVRCKLMLKSCSSSRQGNLFLDALTEHVKANHEYE